MGHGRLLGVWHKRMGAYCVRMRRCRERARHQHERVFQRVGELRHLVSAADHRPGHMRVHLRGSGSHCESNEEHAGQKLVHMAQVSNRCTASLHYNHGHLLDPVVNCKAI